MSIKDFSADKNNLKAGNDHEFTSEELKDTSGGFLKYVKGKHKVFDSVTGKSYKAFANYDKAVSVAKKHTISAEMLIGLLGTGKTRKDIREKEYRDHIANPTYVPKALKINNLLNTIPIFAG